MSISPFAEVDGNYTLTNMVKIHHSQSDWKETLEKIFNDFDIIFDCTTDNDLAHILGSLDINGDIINLSITNHAQELVCVTNPNLYKSLIHIFNLLNNDTEDLYNPTGCWNPTFKAGYNDIAVLVQFAIKQIDLAYEQKKTLRNFVLSTSTENEFNINMRQF
jgi:NADPH:quinone reductase-like Zn-dependent oxidoreductase